MNELKRFRAKFDKRGDNECWNWTATTDGHGYGQFYYMGKNMKASRVAWIMQNGPIPNGLLVCHKCDNPSCVNPKHLFLGTMSDNIMDCVSKGRHPHPIGKGNNTHCPQGHSYSGANLYVSPRGERRCLICQNNHYQKRKLKDKQKRLLASSSAPSECVGCPGQGIDCSDGCVKPAPETPKEPRIRRCLECRSTNLQEDWADDGHGNCGFVYTCLDCGEVLGDYTQDERSVTT